MSYAHCHLLLLPELHSCVRECPWEKAERAEGEQTSDSCMCIAKSAAWEMKEELDQFPSVFAPKSCGGWVEPVNSDSA